MRELTKSMMSCSLAMSMFSARRLLGLITGQALREGPQAAGVFDQIAAVVISQMDETMRATFQSGDHWQRQMIDLMFVPGSLINVSPGKRMDKVGAPSVRAQQQREAAAPASPVSPLTWSWGAPKGGASPAESETSSSSSSTVPAQPPTAPQVSSPTTDGGQDTGWGPMP